jgi:hypothetical protein
MLLPVVSILVYDILDGNSTWYVAKVMGMKVLPVELV